MDSRNYKLAGIMKVNGGTKQVKLNMIIIGITMQQFNILRILRGQNPNSISAAVIKQRMLDRNSDVSRLLDRLIDKKMVIKTQCESDKRATDVKITESGLKLLSKIDLRLEEIDSKLLKLTAKEATQLSDLLDKCRG